MKNNVSLTKFCTDLNNVRGVSNTPLTSTKFKNFCIDYMSAVVMVSFDYDKDEILELFKTLKIDKNRANNENPRNGYKTTLSFEEYIFISFGGTSTDSDGRKTTHLELKGQGCRKFEELGGSWIELFEYLLKYGCRLNRIDLAYDDFTNLLDYKTLIKKVENHEFVSCIKKPPLIYYSMEDGKFKSFSITFGSRNSQRQLQIYDKKSERESKLFKVDNVLSWTRCELRFKKDYAEEIKEAVLLALYNNSFDLLVKGLIGNVVCFKTKADKEHAGRVKNWDKWDKFLDTKERIKIVRQYELEKTISKKACWLKRSVSKTLKELYLSNPTNFNETINYLLVCNLKKLNNKDLDVINNNEAKYDSNLKFKDLDELKEFINSNLYGMINNFDYLKSLLDNHFDSNELVNFVERELLEE